MPNINSIQSLSSTGSFKSPTIYREGQRIGSADTFMGTTAINWLPGVSGTYYDKGLLDYKDQANTRYNNQGYVNAFGNFAANLLVKTLDVIPSAAGGFTATQKGLANMAGLNPNQDMFGEAFDNNMFLDFSKSLQLWGNENFPNFQEEGFSQKGFFEQLSSPGQFLTSNIETLGFLTQSIGLAGLLSKAQIGANVVNRIANGRKAAQVLEQANPANYAKLASQIDDAVLNTFLTTNESAMEAMDAKEQIIQKLEQDRSNGLNKFTDQEIQERANNGLANVFGLNMALGAVTNGFFTSMLKPLYTLTPAATRAAGGGVSAAAREALGTRANSFALGLMDKGEDAFVKEAQNMSPFKRFLFDSGNSAGMVTKGVLGQMLTEGLEENFQYSIQKANEAYNSNQSFKDSLWNTLKDQVTNGWDMTDEERLKNFGTGALIGGGGPLIGMAATAVSKGGQGGFGPLKEAREFRAKREEALKNANTAYTDFFNSSFASKNPVVEGQVATKMQPDGTAKFYNTVGGQTEEITQDDYNALVNTYSPDESGKYKKGGDFVLDAAGNVVKDQAKAAEFAATTQYQSEMDNLIELESAKANADATKIQLYRLEKLRDLAQVAFRTGTTDLLVQKLETLKNPAQDKMASWGLSDPKEVNDSVDSWIKHVERLEANYLQTQNAIVAPVYNDDDREALLNLKLRAADIGNRIVNLYSVQEEIDKELAEKVATVPNKNSEWIGQAFGQGVVTQRTKELKAAAKSPEEAQIAELVAKKKDVQDAIDELSGVYEKMTDPNKGFKQWKAAYKKKDFSPYTGKKMGEKELRLTENTSTATIKNYFEKRANRLNQANRLKLARTYFYNEAIDPFIQYVKQNIRKPEIISEIEKFITDVLEKKLPLTTAQRNKISSIPSQLRQLAKEKEDQFNNLLKRDLIESQLVETIQDNVDVLSALPQATVEVYPNAAPNSVEDFANRLYSLTEKDIEEGNYPRLINDLFYYLQGNTDTLQAAQNTGIEDLFNRVVNYGQQLEDLYGEWDNLITSANDIESQLNTLLPEIDKLGSIKDLEKTDEQFIKEAIEESFEGPNRVLEASDFDGKTISEEYDDLQAVQKQLEFLKNLNDKAFSKLLDEPMYAAAAKKAGQLIKKLEKVEKLVKKNIANKDVKNKKENIHYAEAALELVSELSFVDPKVKELEKKDKDVAAMAVMDLLSEKEPKELKLIEAKLRQELKTIIENLPILKGARTPLTEEQIQFILANPVRGMLQLFSKIQYEEAIAANELSSNTFESPITEYTNTYDVVKFKESLKDLNTSTTAEEFKALLTIHAKFIVLDQIIDAENTGFNHVTFLTAVKKFIEQHPNLPVPSVAQMREVRELVTFAKASPEPSNEMYKNGAALRAPAGAGKSLVVSKLFKEVGNFTDGEILTAAKFDLAAKNIAESIGTPDKANTVEALTKSLKEGKVPPKTKIIIIDEAAALGGNEINDFAAALAAYNKAHPNGKLKFILLYDPNQITQGGLGKSPLDGSFIGDLSTTTDPEYFAGDQETKQQYRTGETKAKQQSVANFSYNLKQITPLSVTYRSSVSEIVDLQNKYKTRQLITEVNTASSVDPTITTEKILGTFSESGSTIAEKIGASIRENGKGRTRIILVGSQAKVEKYKAILPDVEVVTVDEAAGIARDEVYVDLEMSDNENFKPELPITFNQWMYTAISRAKLYVHIANATKPSHSIDNKIETLKPSESTSKAMVDYLTKAIEDLKAITGQEVVPEVKKEEEVVEEEEATAQEESPQEKAEKDQEEREEKTEDENSDTGNEDNSPDEDEPEEPPTQAPIEETDENGEVIEADEASSEEIIISNPPIESIQVGEGFYSPSHSINKVFTTPPNNRTASLKPGDKLMVVKDINPNLGLSRIVLVREVSPGEYQFVSILSDAELRDFSEALGINVNQEVPEYVFKSFGEAYQAKDVNGNEEEVNNAPVVYVQEGSSKMVYEYSEQEQHPLSDDYKDGELQTMRVAIQMLEQIYGPNPQDTIADWDNVKENILDYVDIVSFTKPSEVKKKFGRKPAAQLPKVGPAYLIVSGIKTKKGTSIVPQFVMLTGKVLNQGNSEVQAVQRAVNNIAKIEELLPQANLGGSYAEVRLGVPIKIEGQSGDEYYPFHELVTRLSDAYRALVIKGATEYTINFISRKDASELAKIFPDIDATKLDKDLLKAAYDLDILIHGDVDAKRRNYEGMAQIFANNLGRQQLMATTAQGTNVILRDVKGSKRVDKDGTRGDRKIQETFGLSLLGPIKWYRERGKSNNKLISKKLRNRLETYATRLEKRGKADSSRYAFVKGILTSDANTAHLPPVTYNTLKELFVDSVDKNGNFTLVSDGFGLRTPVSKEFNYNSGVGIREKPVSELVSHLRKIHPTRLVVAKEPNMAAATDAEKYRREREAVAAKYQKVVSVQGFLSADKKRTVLDVLEKFSDDEVQAFIETMKASTLEEAIGIFRAKSEETRLFVTKNKNIFKQLEKSLSTQAQTLEQAIEQDLVSSVDAVEVLKLGGKTASRDFVRATILLRAFGIKDPKHIFQFLNAARKNYNQVYFKEGDVEAQEKNKKRNEDKFLDAINHLSVEFNVEVADFNMNLHEIIDGYLNLFAQKGLIAEEERFDVSYEMIYGPMSLLDKVQFLVELSSKYRAFIRKGGAPAIETPLQQATPAQQPAPVANTTVQAPSNSQQDLGLSNQNYPVFDESKSKPTVFASSLQQSTTYESLSKVQDRIEGSELLEVEEKTLAKTRQKILSVNFLASPNLDIVRFLRNPDVFIGSEFFPQEVQELFLDFIKAPSDFNRQVASKISPAILIEGKDGKWVTLKPFTNSENALSRSKDVYSVDPKTQKSVTGSSDSLEDVIIYLNNKIYSWEFTGFRGEIQSTLFTANPDFYWQLYNTKPDNLTWESYIKELHSRLSPKEAVKTTVTVQAPQTENNQPDVPTTMELPNTVLVGVANEILQAAEDLEEDPFNIFIDDLRQRNPNEVKQLEDLGEGDVYTGAENFIRIDDTTEREKAFLTEDIGREITDKEALEIIDRYTGNNPINKLWRLLRGKGLRENVNIVKYNELVNSRGKKVWGLYRDGVISFARLASGGLSSKLVRHELFHKIFWEYLTVEEQLQALDIAKDNYGDNLNAEQLEERMAEDFESYVSKKDTGFFTRLWNKLKRLLGFTYNNMKSLEQFFDLIEQGAFPYRNKESVIVERNALQFGKKFPNIDDFLIVEKALLESFINAQESRRGRPDVKGRIFSELNEETGETEYFITKLGATEPIDKEDYDYYKQEYGVEDNRLFTIKGGGDMAAMTFSETITLALANMKELAENPRANIFPKRMAPETAEHIKRVLKEALSDSKFIIDLTQYYFGQADIKEGLSRFLKENNADQIEVINQILEARAAKDYDPETAEEIDSYLEEFDDADLEDMKKGLENETYDSALVDPTIKLTGSIKQRLISIKYYKNGTSHYADINGAFSAIVPRVSGIPADSLESAVTALEQNFRGFAKFNTARMTLENAVGRYMYNTVSRIKNTLNDPNRIKSVAFRKDVNSEDIYVMHLTEKGIAAGIDIENVVINDVNYGPINRTLARSEALKDYFAVKDVNADNTLHKVISQISEETGVFYDDIAKLYYWYEDIDFIKAIVSSVSSLRKARPFAFQSKWHYGEYRVRGYNIKTESSRQVHETNLEYRLDNYIKDIFKKNEADPNKKLPLFSEDFKKAFSDAQQAKGEDSIKAKRAVIRKFLNLLNYKRKVDFAGDDAIESFFDRLEYALPQMEEAFAETRDNFETEEAYQASKTSEYLLDNESSLLTELAEIINSAYSMSNSSSYIRSDGKKAYGWQEASFQTQILSSIIGASKEGRLVRGAAHLKLAPYSRPVAVSPFLKDNIFVGNNPMNNIESYVDYEAWKEKGQERYSKYIRKETSIDFNKRNIVGNFISVIAAKGSRYMQSLPIPSNRTTVQEVEVSVLNKTAIDTALTRIITSQRNRPNPNAAGNDRLRKNKNYMANWQKWKFAGLQGYVTDTNPKTKKPYTNKEILDQIKAHVEGQVNNLLPLFQETLDKPAAIKLPISSLNRTAAKLGIKTEKPLGIFKKDMSDEEKTQFFKTRDEIVKEILKSFYYNYIINQYSLAQILYSDETFYNGMEDETKRIQILTATGEVTLVDPVHGVPPKSKVLIMEDIRGVVEYDKSQIAESFNAPYEKSDGEGFMLPEFYEKIAHSYGLNAQTDIIMKPVYADIDEQGVPTGIKYSVKVLTDELCQTFPHLAEYREAMRKVGADQLVFSSAVKMGNINTLAKMDADTGRVLMDSVTQESVITIDNTNFRFQLNPAKKVEADTANGSQMTAMMNTNGQNTVEIYDVHKIDEFLIENGLRDLARKLRTTRKGSMTKRSIENLRKELLSKLENLPGATDVYEILNARLSDGTRAAISMPLISDRVVSTLASMVTDHTVGFRFSGSKLVLQADTAPVEIYNPVTKQMETRFLKFKDENGYTEVILPREYAQYFTLGDVFDAKGKKIHDGENSIEDGVVGFRIPTSNYHSVVSMKVVGFYDVPSNSKGNLIIAPSAIVYYHGSDYDVDTLFIIKKEIYKEKEALNLNNMISVFDPNHKEDPALIFKKGDVPGYPNNKEYRTSNNERLHEYLEVIIRKASAIIDTKVEQANKATVAAGKAIWEEINAMEKNLNKISTIAAAAAKNTKVDLFAKNIREEKNKRDLATPITFTRIVRVRYKIREEIKDTILTDDKFMQKLVEENLIKLEC